MNKNKVFEQDISIQEMERKKKSSENGIKIKGLFKDFQKIGIGSSSIVYSVKDRNFVNYTFDNDENPKFALKFIKKSYPHAKTLFTNEIQILKQLTDGQSHPNIVKIFEEMEDQIYFCIKTELLCGPELFEFIAAQYQNSNSKPFENLFLMECAKQLLNTVEYMHGIHQIAHRDIKPSNIKFRKKLPTKMICRHENRNQKQKQEEENYDNSSSSCFQFELVFIDFAFSKQIQLDEIYENVEQVGTVKYVAPEILFQKQLSGKQILSSDMYSLGSLLYVLMTGRLPFNGSSVDEIKRNKKKGKIRWNISNFCEESCDLLQKMLEQNCDKRINVKQALGHPWFTMVEDSRRRSTNSTSVSPTSM